MIFDLKKINVYGTPKIQKKRILEEKFQKLILHHYKNSSEYKKFLNFLNYNLKNKKIENFPFLPANIFKKLELLSVKKKEIVKTIRSSGTSGNSTSKIYLDKNNSINQMFVLSKLITNYIGNKRLPMLIVDYKSSDNIRDGLNARKAAINGFSIFGKEHTCLLNDEKKIDIKKLSKFINNFGQSPFLIFGFTSLIYEHFINNDELKNQKFNFKNGILIHGGGWKKMEDKKISNKIFKNLLKKNINLYRVINYYGLAEQTGTIFLECENCSKFIISGFSEVFIRDKNFNLLKDGESGLIQLLSLLPTSYPGHNIITEDIGRITDNRNCKCSKLGKTFEVFGRIKKSEIRGCSDTL